MSETQIGYGCGSCSFEWRTEANACPSCGSTQVGRLFAVALDGTIMPRGTLEAVTDNQRGDTQTIQYLSPAGGRSNSTLSPQQLEVTLNSPIDFGRKGESFVVERV